MLIWEQRGNLYKLRGSGDTLGKIRIGGIKQIKKPMKKTCESQVGKNTWEFQGFFFGK